MKKRIGIVGARGYTGAELLKLVANHPHLELDFVSSREQLGATVEGFSATYLDHDPEALSDRDVDAVVLAVPNGKTQPYIDAFESKRPSAVIVDLSADRRFDPEWQYGLPELTRDRAAGSSRISNPGCYATAMQFAIAPLLRAGVLDPLKAPACFGVSGYSGAGTTPSDKNNTELLHNNLMPYASVGHMHEREVSHQLGTAVEFMPNVAEFFRGISMTVNVHLSESRSAAELIDIYRTAYAGEPLISVIEETPWVSRIAGKHGAQIGGITVSEDGLRAVVVATLDNLLKGAATQAMHNINNAFGFDELTSIPVEAIS